MKIAFRPAKGIRLDQDFKGRVEFDIEAISSTVPFSSIEFHRRNAEGKEEFRSASVVPAKLSMGWRTNTIPNGKYEVWYVGHVKTNKSDTVVESERVHVNVKN